jgi:hypothetical protein
MSRINTRLQVNNRGSCIKIAMDFVYVNSIGPCLQILPEMLVEKGGDRLHIPHLLWHAWLSLTELLLAHDTNAQARSAAQNTDHINAVRNDKSRCQLSRQADSSRFKLKCPHPNCKSSKRRTFDRYGILGHL